MSFHIHVSKYRRVPENKLNTIYFKDGTRHVVPEGQI